jgi:hypothetical protein
MVEGDVLKLNIEQRLDSRFNCAGPALAYFVPGESPITSCIIDLSVSGGLIVLDKPRNAPIGTSLELGFSVNRLSFRVRAQVRAIRSPTALGLVFLNVNERIKLHLEDLIEELAATHLNRSSSELLTMIGNTEAPSPCNPKACSKSLSELEEAGE